MLLRMKRNRIRPTKRTRGHKILTGWNPGDASAFTWATDNRNAEVVRLRSNARKMFGIVRRRRRESDLEKFIEEVEGKHRNIVWPDPLVNSQTVDRFFCKGSPNPTVVQRIAAWLFSQAQVSDLKPGVSGQKK